MARGRRGVGGDLVGAVCVKLIINTSILVLKSKNSKIFNKMTGGGHSTRGCYGMEFVIIK
jgi:hypothetical protein